MAAARGKVMTAASEPGVRKTGNPPYEIFIGRSFIPHAAHITKGCLQERLTATRYRRAFEWRYGSRRRISHKTANSL